MPLPVFDPQRHSVGINGFGFMRDSSAPIHRDDALPATARSAQGEGRYDSFQDDSYLAQADWSGGVGQGRFRAGDAVLSAIGDGRRGGFFPAKKRLTSAGTGGTTWEMFERLGVLYGMTATQIEQIESSTVQAITSGTQLCEPEVTASNNVVWATSESGTQKLRRWNGSAITDVTVPSVTPYLVKLYNRFLWSFGTRTLNSTLTLQGAAVKYENATAQTAHTLTIPTPARPNNTGVITIHIDANAAAPTVSGWNVVPSTVSGMVYMAYRRMTGAETSVPVVLAVASGCTIIYQQLNGTYTLTDTSAFDTADTQANASGVATCPTPTITPTNADSILIAAGTKANGVNLNIGLAQTVSSWSNSFTALSESNGNATDHNGFAAYRIVSSIAAYTTTATVAGTGSTATSTGMIAAFQKTPLTADITQTAVHYTLDDGANWHEAFGGDTAGIPIPRAGVAAEGFLWLTTDRKLYRMAVDETAFESDALNPVLTVAFGEVDKWDVPLDVGVIGRQIDVSERVIYWGVGGTVRQYAPNGIGRQIWPPDDWATQAGAVQGITAGEGGLYFGAGGYLYNYNGRGFHCLAKETTAGDFDYLKWHQGRLYLKHDPGAYYDFKYPSMRPDIVLTDPSTFETGYSVSSLIDNEKTTIDKVLPSFQLQGYFTAGATDAETGTLKLEYYAGNVPPDKLGGGATSLTWTLIGTLGGSDGTYFKDFTLATPIVEKRYWLRVTNTPGTLGYPVLTTYKVDGRALMPSIKRFIMPLRISTSVRDRQGNVMYPLPVDVKAAFDALEDLRPGSYFTLNYLDGPDSVVDYTVTSEQKLESINGFWHDASVSGLVQFVCKQLPT